MKVELQRIIFGFDDNWLNELIPKITFEVKVNEKEEYEIWDEDDLIKYVFTGSITDDLWEFYHFNLLQFNMLVYGRSSLLELVVPREIADYIKRHGRG